VGHTPLAFDATLPLEQGLPARRGEARVLVLCHRRGPERSSGPLASDLPRAANEANTLMTLLSNICLISYVVMI
jgi:hypothetical protein